MKARPRRTSTPRITRPAKKYAISAHLLEEEPASGALALGQSLEAAGGVDGGSAQQLGQFAGCIDVETGVGAVEIRAISRKPRLAFASRPSWKMKTRTPRRPSSPAIAASRSIFSSRASPTK